MKKYLITLAFTFLFVILYAQDDFDDDNTSINRTRREVVKDNYAKKNYQGTITDQATGKPLAGVQIQAFGNGRYTAITDENGKFKIQVPTFTTSLYLFAPDYLSLQTALPIDTTTEVKVAMLSDRYREMYSASTNICAKSELTLNHTAGFTVDNDINTELSADVRSIMRSGTPGVGATMFIRGLGSINADAQPLIVIDGIEQDMQRGRTVLHSGQFINMLGNISPDDIEKVEILKNATAIYGARGGNGVIAITTKRGHSMATRIDANISVGLTTIPQLPKMMNASQYRNYAVNMIGTMANANETGQYKFLNDDPTGYYYNLYHNDTDWSKYTYRDALSQNYSINVQGGDNVGMYNLSVGYADAKSNAKQNGTNRLNVRFNSDIKILWNLYTKFDMSISRTTADVFDDGVPSDFSTSTITSPTFLAKIKSPLLSPYQYNQIIGGFSNLLSDADDIFEQLGKGYSLANPVAILENGKDDNKNHSENTFFNARLEPTFEINRYWKATAMFSYSLDRMSQRYFRPYTGVPSFEIAELGTVTSMTASLFSKEINVVASGRVDYERIFGAHSLKAYAGMKYNYFSYDDNDLRTQYNSETNDKNPSLSATAGFQTSEGTEDVWKNIQMYAAAQYNFKQRYFVDFALTGEANSRFGENVSGLSLFGVKWAIFPSIQAGWVMTNESWFPRTNKINYLRINAGYDISGNDNISNYAARTSLSSVLFNYRAVGLKLTNIGNDEIQWETTKKFNVGLSASLLNNRLGVAFDYYIHNTDNLLTLKTFDNPIAGINRYWTNGGSLKNTGYEATLTGKPIVARSWHLELGASVGHYSNKVKSLPDGDYTSSVYGTDNVLTAVGQPVAVFYGYKTAGVFSTEAEAAKAGKDGYLYMKDEAGNPHEFVAGDVHFLDLNNDGMISDADKTIIGNPNPDIYGNIFANLNWKDLTLSLNFNYSLGNDIYNYQRSILNSSSSLYNQQVQSINYWRYEGQVTDIPRLNYGDPLGNNRMSDRWIEDGSYLRLKSLKLNYRIPIPGSWDWLQGLSVWGEISNLITITKYTGSDPEMSTANSVLYQGVDTGDLPQSRSFTMGVRISL